MLVFEHHIVIGELVDALADVIDIGIGDVVHLPLHDDSLVAMLLPLLVYLVKVGGCGFAWLSFAYDEVERKVVSVYSPKCVMQVVTRYCHAIIIKVKIILEKVLHFVYEVLYYSRPKEDKTMEYNDYKDEWEGFFTTQMRFAFNSASIDMSRVSDEEPLELAEAIVSRLITNFAHKNSFGRYYRFSVINDWVDRFMRKDLIDKAISLIEKTRKDDQKEGL